MVTVAETYLSSTIDDHVEQVDILEDNIPYTQFIVGENNKTLNKIILNINIISHIWANLVEDNMDREPPFILYVSKN